MNDTKQSQLPIKINVLIQEKHGYPAIELRRITIDPLVIKAIISAAYRNTPLVILPVFQDPIKSLGSLLEKGVIYKSPEDGEYYFNI